ncbi:MAG: hypothetical protein ACJASC_002325 [Limimaricola cinnabarinus]|jgi:hypothetical protein|uniref:hypothetical protein n=1 Tax=Limimaricola cinnabarinus TaxID=1125964 RepID=UPI0039E5AB7B
MFDLYPDFTSAFDALRVYVEVQHDGLLHAAELLGGRDGLRLAQSVIEGVARPHLPTDRTLKACGEMLDLLTLEHVHDPSRIEAERFAALDPAWPVVEDICLLADGFKNVLHDYLDEAAQQPMRPSQVAA